jgi:hypothetical protein
MDLEAPRRTAKPEDYERFRDTLDELREWIGKKGVKIEISRGDGGPKQDVSKLSHDQIADIVLSCPKPGLHIKVPGTLPVKVVKKRGG